jgi:predicted flap endonuclease-1-like 5' DNA nuclease
VTFLLLQMTMFLLGTAVLFGALGWLLARRRGRDLLQEMDDAWSARHRAVLQSFDRMKEANEAALSVSLTADNLIESARSRAERLQVEVDELRRRLTDLETGAARRPARVEPDDLKQIRGIGLVLEKKLHALGITSFRQIALWTGDDVQRMSEQLAGFPDRIVRDRWVERAADEHFQKYGEALGRTTVSAN